MSQGELDNLVNQLSNGYDILSDGVVIVDCAGHLVYANSASEKLFGYSAEELLGQHYSIVFPDGHLAAAIEGLETTPYSGWEGNITVTRRGGEKVLAVLTSTLAKEDSENAIAMVAIVREISEPISQSEATGESAVIAEIGRIASLSSNIGDIYDGFVREVNKLLQFDSLRILAVDAEMGTAIPVHISGMDWSRGTGEEFSLSSLSRVPLLQVIESKVSVLVQGAESKEILERFPGYSLAVDSGFRSFINVPILLNGAVVGVLNLRSKKGNAYSDEQVRIVERIAFQIAGSVANVQLHASLQREARERRALSKISRAVSSSLDIDEVCDRLVTEIEKLLTFDHIVIGTVEQEKRTATIRYVAGETVAGGKPGDAISLSPEMMEWYLDNRSGAVIQGEIMDSLPPAIRDGFPAITSGLFKSVIAIQCFSGDQQTGFLCIGSRKANAYSKSDARLANLIGLQVAGSVASAQLYASTQREAVERAAMAEIARIVSSSLDIGEVYDSFAEEMGKLISFDRVAIGTFDHASGTTKFSYVAGEHVPGGQPGDVMRLSADSFDWHNSHSSGFLLQGEKLEKLRRVKGESFPTPVSSRFKAIMAVPLISHEQNIGFIAWNSWNPDAFSDSDLDLAYLIGVQISSSVANARLHASLREEAAERATVAEIGRIVSSSLDINEIYEQFAKKLRQLIPCEGITINIIDIEQSTFDITYISGMSIPGMRTTSIPLKGSITKEIAQSKSSLLLAPEKDDRLITRYSVIGKGYEQGFRNFLFVPLISKDRVIGTLNLHTKDSEAYDDSHLARAESVANQISGAIANSQLYSQRLAAEESLLKAHNELESRVQERTAELQRSETRIRAIMDTTVDGIVTIDEQGYIDSFNLGAELMFGYKADEVLGQSVNVLMPDHFSKDHDGHMKRYASTGNSHVMGLGREIAFGQELAGLRKDGTIFPINLTIGEFTVGKRKLFTGTIRDITTSKQVEEELKRAKEQAEIANRAKSDFLAAMSHEIRTPMNGVIGMTDILINTPLTADQKRYADLINVSANSLLAVINDILDFSKIEAGMMEISSTDFSLRDCINQSMDVFSLQAGQKRIQLSSHIQNEVPDGLIGDSSRLRQVIVNLVGNSIKFTESGKVAVSVELVSPESDTIELHFRVIDTGIGMTSEQKRVIFNAFSQVTGSTTPEYGGTGLGLSISSKIVEAMNGQIWAESEFGKGSVLHFVIPFKASEASLTITKIFKTQLPVTHSVPIVDQHSPQVLVAEDNPVSQEFLSTLLDRRGYSYRLVENGNQALEALERGAFDIVLMDVQMPGLDGLETTIAIRQSEESSIDRIPIIGLTAYAMEGDRERCLNAGMDDYLSKPIRADDLYSALDRMMPVPLSVSPGEVVPNEPQPTAADSISTSILGSDPVLNSKVAKAFLDYLPRQMSDLESAVARLDTKAIGRFAHQLKGAAAMLSDEVVESTNYLEVTANADDFSEIQNAYSALRKEVQTLESMLLSFMKNESADFESNRTSEESELGLVIHVLVVDDHPVVRQGLKEILARHSDLRVTDEAASAAEALSKARTATFDVVVLDIDMPGRSGLDALKDLKREHPDLPVLLMSMHPEELYAVRAFKSRASGYITKESMGDELVAAIRKIYSGGLYVSEKLGEKLALNIGIEPSITQHDTLSDRELEVVRALASGKSNSDVASEMNLSPKTISTYKTRALEKMGISNNAELIQYAMTHGLTEAVDTVPTVSPLAS